jgi:hypothetical protein
MKPLHIQCLPPLPLLISISKNAKTKMTKQQHRFLKIIGITSSEAYEKYNIPHIDTYIEKTCINIVERIFKDPIHPLTQAQDQIPKPQHFRNAHIRLSKAKTASYENSCLQAVLKLKRDGYKVKYTKPRRKEATTIDYNLEIQKRKKKANPKRLQKRPAPQQQNTSETTCQICNKKFKI